MKYPLWLFITILYLNLQTALSTSLIKGFFVSLIKVMYKGRDSVNYTQLNQHSSVRSRHWHWEFLCLSCVAQVCNEHSWLGSRADILACSGALCAYQNVWFVQITGGCNNLFQKLFRLILSNFYGNRKLVGTGKIQQYWYANRAMWYHSENKS